MPTNEEGAMPSRECIIIIIIFICWNEKLYFISQAARPSGLDDFNFQLSLRIQQLDVICETKTKDNVFINVTVSVQYRVVQASAYEAFYRLTDPRGQIQSYVFDVVRSTIPKLELDESFASKDDISSAVLKHLQGVMKVRALVF